MYEPTRSAGSIGTHLKKWRVGWYSSISSETVKVTAMKLCGICRALFKDYVATKNISSYKIRLLAHRYGRKFPNIHAANSKFKLTYLPGWFKPTGKDTRGHTAGSILHNNHEFVRILFTNTLVHQNCLYLTQHS